MTDGRAAAHGLFRALPLSGKALVLVLSVSAHAGVALAFARQARPAIAPASSPRDPLVELDLETAAPPVQLADVPRAVLPPASRSEPPVRESASRDPVVAHLQPVPSAEDAAPSAAPTVIDSAPSPALPRFAITVGSAAPGRPTAADAQAAAPSRGAAVLPVPEASVDTAATLLAGNRASYTPEAQAAGVEAEVPLEIVVDEAGAVIGARALAHVGYGLDEAALRSIRGYRFSPARRAGKALAVRMRWLMRFQLQ